MPDVVDPLGGSYYVEALTAEFERKVLEELERIERMGGMVKAIEAGYVRKAIAQDAYRTHLAWETGDKVKVGVNKYRIDEDEPPRQPYAYKPEEEQRQLEAVKQLRRERDNAAVDKALKRIVETAQRPAATENNLMPPIIEAVRAYATIGEICGALRQVFGEYSEPTSF